MASRPVGSRPRAPPARRTAEPGRDASSQSNVILLERQPIRSGRQVLKFVTNKKPRYAGVDPYNLYIDRNSADNVMEVR